LIALEPIYPELEIELGDRLRKKFGLRDVLVVNTKFVRSKYKRVTDSHDEDDEVHRYLANWAARLLSTIIRKGDVLGMGSGRALNAIGPAVSKLSGFQGCRVICALTGVMKVGLWGHAGHMNTVDANDNARGIYEALPTELRPQINLVEADITDVGSRSLLEQYQNETTVAIVGIGALGGRHQLRRVARESDSDCPRELLTVFPDLESLAKLADEIEEAPKASSENGYVHEHIVSDICNHLVLNEWLAKSKSADDVSALRRLIISINDKFLNTSPEMLSQMCERGAVVAVAGGRHKAAAVFDVLKQFGPGGSLKHPAVSHLIVDDLVAWQLNRMN
jgi:DNA-binding transcriptional regulator LsrR (DeoR family)